jgi:hypothetical protein
MLCYAHQHHCKLVLAQALELLQRMQYEGVTSDVYSFSSAIDACSKSGHLERAQALLADISNARPQA